MAKSRKKHGANELSLALGISAAILVIGVVVFLLSPKVCTGSEDCKKVPVNECTSNPNCTVKRKLFSALMSDVNKGGYNLQGTQRKTGVCCDQSTGNACQGFRKDQGKAGCGGTATPGCVWKPGAVACIPPIKPQPQPQPQPSGQNCLCGAGKDDWQNAQCGDRGPVGGDDLCMDNYGTGGLNICGNVGGKTGCEGNNPQCAGFSTKDTCDTSLGCKWGTFSDNPQDGCVMTSRKPHTMDVPDNQDNVNVRTGPCGGGNVICFDGGECEERSTGLGCQSQCYFPISEAAIQKCNADNNVVEGFRARRKRRCM